MGKTQEFIMKPKIDFCFKELMEEELDLIPVQRGKGGNGSCGRKRPLY